MAYERQNDNLSLLRQGKAPQGLDTLMELSCGLDSMTDFFQEHYLLNYICESGSKIKFLTGRPGSGKTHLARYLSECAGSMGYLTVSFSAEDIWLHDFREVYLEILRQCEIQEVLSGCARQIIRELGYDPAKIAPGSNLMDYLSERGEGDALSKGEIRTALRRCFTRNPRLDNCFAACCSLLTGDILGHPILESASRELILSFLNGDKSVKLSQMRALGISPSPITKYNARYLLRSLCELVHLGGWEGLFVVIDDLEVLLRRNADSGGIRYTRLRREDTYESIRQLIDDIDSMRYVCFLLCFDRELIDSENYGLKSYQALWLRIQNEVVSTRFNRFADIIDLDRYADESYDAATLCRMSEHLAAYFNRNAAVNVAPIDAETAKSVMERARYGALGLPYLMNRAVLEGGREHV